MIISKIFQKRTLCLVAVTVLFAVSFFWLHQEKIIAMTSGPYYEGNGGKQAVSLCINVDWGEDYIPAMLETLKEHDAKATFFLTGRWTEKFPDTARLIKTYGMEIGNHGLKHNSPNGMSYEENIADIREAEKIIAEVLHINTVLFAPPSGEIEEQVQQAAEDAGYQLILWSVDTIDWQKPPTETIVARVLEKAKDGSIVLMHPTEHTSAALDEILTGLEEKNLTVLPVSQLIK